MDKPITTAQELLDFERAIEMAYYDLFITIDEAQAAVKKAREEFNSRNKEG